MRALVVLAAASMALANCSEKPEPKAQPCPAPSEAPDLSAVPKQLHLADHATITEVKETAKGVGVTAVSDLPVVEVYPPLARAILDAGYSIIASDNEGFEAEIFFGDDVVTGAYRLREAPCGDQVIVRLLFDDPGSRGRK